MKSFRTRVACFIGAVLLTLKFIFPVNASNFNDKSNFRPASVQTSSTSLGKNKEENFAVNEKNYKRKKSKEKSLKEKDGFHSQSSQSSDDNLPWIIQSKTQSQPKFEKEKKLQPIDFPFQKKEEDKYLDFRLSEIMPKYIISESSDSSDSSENGLHLPTEDYDTEDYDIEDYDIEDEDTSETLKILTLFQILALAFAVGLLFLFIYYSFLEKSKASLQISEYLNKMKNNQEIFEILKNEYLKVKNQNSILKVRLLKDDNLSLKKDFMVMMLHFQSEIFQSMLAKSLEVALYCMVKYPYYQPLIKELLFPVFEALKELEELRDLANGKK